MQFHVVLRSLPLILLFTLRALAANLTGHWLHEDTAPDGNVTQIVLILTQQGTQLAGKVVFSWGELKINEGSVAGDAFHFTVMTPADSKQPAVYEGKLVDAELEVSSRWPGNNNTHFIFTRASNDFGLPPARIQSAGAAHRWREWSGDYSTHGLE